MALTSGSGFFRSILARYGVLSQENPWSMAFVTCTIKGCIADYIAQRFIEDTPSEKLDVPRNLLFGFYGGWYCGWVQHAVYNILYTKLFGTSTSTVNALRKVAFDSVVHVPFFVFPIYFVYKHTLYDGDGPIAGIERYLDDAKALLLSYYTVWVPANLAVFTIVPMRFRIGFVATTSLGWLSISSFLTHGGLS